MERTKNGLAKFEYFEDLDTLYWEWLDVKKDTPWENVQEAMVEYAAKAEECKAENHLVNEQDQQLRFTPENQLWLDENVSPKTIASGCKRFAIVQRIDVFKQIATEQLFEGENTKALKLGIFYEKEKAFEWIKQFV